jgi:hypothetical protein
MRKEKKERKGKELKGSRTGETKPEVAVLTNRINEAPKRRAEVVWKDIVPGTAAQHAPGT